MLSSRTTPATNDRVLGALVEDLALLAYGAAVTLRQARPGEQITAPSFSEGTEVEERIEQRTRALLLDPSLTPEQARAITHLTHNVADLVMAADIARDVRQITLLLTPPAAGDYGAHASLTTAVYRTAAAVARLAEGVTAVLQAQDAVDGANSPEEAAATKTVAAEFREYLAAATELRTALTAARSAAVPPLMRRLGRAAGWALQICAEGLARTAARFALPERVVNAMERPQSDNRSDVNDGVLRPLPRFD